MFAAMIVAIAVERAGHAEQRQASSERIGAMGHDIERRTSTMQAYLISGAALFNARGIVDQATFGRFAATIERDSDLKGVLAIGWAETQIGQAAAGNRTIPGRARQQGQQAPQVIRLISPETAPNLAARGFDLSSEARRSAAMVRASQTGAPTVTDKITLVQDLGKPDRPGIAMFMPVYSGSPRGADSAGVRGYVFAAMRIDEYIKAALGSAYSPTMPLQIFDNSEAADNLLLAQGAPIEAGSAVRRTISVANHIWIVKTSAAPSSLFSQAAMFIVLAGLIIGGLLANIVRLAIRQAQSALLQLEVREEQDSIRAILTRELNHRVKNALANVLSILALSRRGATDIDQFVETFSGRVQALSATHNLLMQSSWSAVKVSDVVNTELAPFAAEDHQRIVINGEDFELAPNDALSLGLLLHELATNAGKYGALSNAAGMVNLIWRKVTGALVLFEWTERGGPEVAAHPVRGFGSDLIEKVISRQLKSDIKLEFAATGVHCRFYLPVRAIVPFNLRQQS